MSRRSQFGRFLPWLLIPAVLGTVLLIQTRLFRESTCETYDEYTYLLMGLCIFRHGDFASLASPMCPPLPILLEYWLPALGAQFAPMTTAWDHAVPAMTRQARLLTATTIGVPLVWLVFAWLGRRRHWLVGTLGGGLVALSPTVLAAASVATTDACFALFGVLAVAAIQADMVRRSRWSYWLAGGAIGLALASKQSAAILFPVVLLELLLQGPPERRPGWTQTDLAIRFMAQVAFRLVGLVAIAFLVVWALYGFGLAPYGVAGTSTTVPVLIPMVANLLPNGEAIMEAVRHSGAPLAYDTFMGQMNHAAEGHTAYLMGQHSHQGWWYFFPVALAIKSTPTELILMALAAGLACQPATWRDSTRRLWLTTGFFMLGAGIASKINIGQRYMILIYPLVILLGSDWLGAQATRRRGLACAAGAALLVWQAISAVGIAPHYLSYFNSFCGGPMAGHRYLVDSSLDWGQDLPSLRRELEARNYRQVALCYFGTAQTDVYGLRAVEWKPADETVAAACDYLAISATARQGDYGGGPELSERLRNLPSTRAGYSIFIYDLNNPAIRAVWNEIRRAPAGPSIRPARPQSTR